MNVKVNEVSAFGLVVTRDQPPETRNERNFPISYLLSAIFCPAGPGVDGGERGDKLEI